MYPSENVNGIPAGRRDLNDIPLFPNLSRESTPNHGKSFIAGLIEI